MENNKNLISLVISVIIIIILIQIEPLRKNNFSEVLGVVVVFTISFFVVRFFYTLFLKSNTGKSIEREIENKKELKEVKKDLQNNLLEYENAKRSFKYFSNKKLESIYLNFKENNIENMERLALEEIMVEKGILSYSEMHEKMHMINNYFNEK